MRNSKNAIRRIAKNTLFLCAFLSFSTLLFAQKSIKGRISDVSGTPLSGASVTVKGTTRGTSTNSAGEFSIEANPGDILEVSMIGFQSASLHIDRNTADLSLQLQPKSSTVDEIIVIGYGTQKRANVTGAISTVN